ncbi:MAG: RagB/SusD family nutrient uptake outer membrane protein [Tannerella sp.]|jgi:hypothetical protein|nr:RagB/SusD family nutrient uptake outer membrane protein [Tannerella sp.]
MKSFIKKISLTICICSILWGCDEDWLETKPLSIYTPETVYVDAAGFESALGACMRNIISEFYGDAAPIVTEMIQSDLCVEGTTNKTGPQQDMDQAFLPSAQLDHVDYTRVGWFWTYTFNVVKYCNTIITRIDDIEWTNTDERNHILGSAFFHRAYRYYRAVHQFGDVPFLDEELTAPKTDFYSHDRWDILERLYSDMEFAYKWVRSDMERGNVTKDACGVLLMKIAMSLGKFDRAIEIGHEIVSRHPLMKQRFTVNQNKPRTNLMHDLHSIEAKLDRNNMEGIFYTASYPDVVGSVRIFTMRCGVPSWNTGGQGTITPAGETGTAWNVSAIAEDVLEDPDLDINRVYGRGTGKARPTNYFQYEIWGEKELNDIRGVHNRDSWRRTEDLKYNNPALKKSGSEWYRKNLQKNVNISVNDSIMCWHQWPHYKLFVPEKETITQWSGGETPWYIYRSAEVYLMLGECYYWKDQPVQAAEMLNVVRARAGAEPLSAADINIGEILNERARELYYEELRHVELVRISYLYAKTGKTCEVFGRTYSPDNFSGPGGIRSNVKEYGVNFWWDWVMTKNNFYRERITTSWYTYQVSVHHVLWPVPEEAVTSNVQGVINQNTGYPGAENNKPSLSVPPVSPQTEGY